MSKLLRMQDVSEMLEISIPTIYNWIRDNKIPYVRLGKCYKFRLQDIEELIETSLVPVREQMIEEIDDHLYNIGKRRRNF